MARVSARGSPIRKRGDRPRLAKVLPFAVRVSATVLLMEGVFHWRALALVVFTLAVLFRWRQRVRGSCMLPANHRCVG